MGFPEIIMDDGGGDFWVWGWKMDGGDGESFNHLFTQI